MDIRIVVVEQGEYDGGPIRFSGTLDEVIASFVVVRTSIPELYRSTAEVEIEAEDNYGSAHAKVTVTYNRPETSEETAARKR